MRRRERGSGMLRTCLATTLLIVCAPGPSAGPRNVFLRVSRAPLQRGAACPPPSGALASRFKRGPGTWSVVGLRGGTGAIERYGEGKGSQKEGSFDPDGKKSVGAPKISGRRNRCGKCSRWATFGKEGGKPEFCKVRASAR
jgi:hypothetical protein